MFNRLKKATIKFGAVLTGTLISAQVFAAEQSGTVDYGVLTSKIDFTGAIQAVLGVISLVVTALVAWKGGQWIIKAVRGA